MITTQESKTPEHLLRHVGAWLSGHFLFTSGLHGREYIQCQKVLQYPRYGMALAEQIVAKVHECKLSPTVVIGPALGAIHWEVMIATALDNAHPEQEPIKAIFAERVTDDLGDENAFAIRRGLEIDENDRVLIVEDVTTTGGSVRKVIDVVKKWGATPVGVAAIADRSGGKIDFGIPFIKLLTMELAAYKESECPMCKEGSKPIKPGSSKK